jgi:uncharacterized protein (DUF2235 family)
MKNIVICCDGTANRFTEESKNTNVVKLFCSLEKDDPAHQVTYYDPGVGTRDMSNFSDWFDRATGSGVKSNIKQAYQYLMDSYEEGDRLFLFGFSRGAYTVRALSGMVNRCGLLPKRNVNLIDDAFYYYSSPKVDKKLAASFKENFSREVPIHFLGVWDTVKAVFTGRLRKGYFRDNHLADNVRHACQALSIDEERGLFRPVLWDQHDPARQTLDQVWFAGVHSDVGGSYAEAGLSNITLQWMFRQGLARGLRLKPGTLDNPNFQPNPGDVLHRSRVQGWRLLPRHERPIPPQSALHVSILDRLGEARYYPPNLRGTPEELQTQYRFVDISTCAEWPVG